MSSLSETIAKYKMKYPESEDPLDYISAFGFTKILQIVNEALDKNKEIEFKTEKQKITYNLK